MFVIFSMLATTVSGVDIVDGTSTVEQYYFNTRLEAENYIEDILIPGIIEENGLVLSEDGDRNIATVQRGTGATEADYCVQVCNTYGEELTAQISIMELTEFQKSKS